MPEITIPAELRTEFGKGAARRLRRANKVPAVLYGHGTDPVHVALPGHEALLALRTPNVLINVELPDSRKLALPRHVQRDPIKGFIEHVDLLLVKKGEKVTVEIPVTPVGEPEPGALVTQEHAALSVEAEATRIPQGIEVSIEGLPAGTLIHAKDLPLPDGVELKSEPETLIVHIAAMPTAEEVAAELGEAPAAAAEEAAPTGEAAAEEA